MLTFRSAKKGEALCDIPRNRQYLPKGADFTAVTGRDFRAVMDKPNNRPRKCLGMKTPNQAFFGIEPTVALAS